MWGTLCAVAGKDRQLRVFPVMLSKWSRVARRIRVPAGFLFAAFYLWLARPSAVSMAWSLLLVIPGLLLRAYASGYVKKNAELTVTGPYAYTRNPLYLGSILMAFGFAAASRNLWITLALALLFLLIYGPTIYSEEQFLRSTFPSFGSYAQRVPRLFPRFTPARIAGDGSFSGALYRQHREYNSVLGACAVYAVLVAVLFLRH
jgi:protein-S-isoprenylcysteine O-methyltransferase Ste14